MGNVVQISRPCAYLVSRAARHRRAERFDEAMALLTKAKNEFGMDEQIEFETACVYESMGCENEAARAYLRVVRCEGRLKHDALFRLADLALQRSDVERAEAYYFLFSAEDSCSISPEEVLALQGGILRAACRPLPCSRKGRARMLERRAAEQIQKGKNAAAFRALKHALALYETPKGLMLLACCQLLRGNPQEAAVNAQRAHERAPGSVQALCVLSDALACSEEPACARRWLYLAALRAKHSEDIYAAALESAKQGEDRLTLLLTGKVLRCEPFDTQAMMLRACALINLGRYKEAVRLFGRLCGLLPEDSVCESYFRLFREGNKLSVRLDLGMDVMRAEGVERASRMVSALCEEPDAIASDAIRLRRLCRDCAWALRSAMAGSGVSAVALILMSEIGAPQAREVLEDLLCDPNADQQIKLAALQILTSKEGFKPYYADINGRLVRLAAGGVCSKPLQGGENSRLLQQACDLLTPQFRDAPTTLMPIFLKYMEMYPKPARTHEAACVAALICVYHLKKGRSISDIENIMRRSRVSRRQLALFVRRLLKAAEGVPEEDPSVETEENI